MLEDSSSDEEKPARKVEISDDDDGGNSKRGSSDGSSCPENQENEDPRQSAEIEVENIDNTYDYNDSFIDDNSSEGTEDDDGSQNDSDYEYSEKDATDSESDGDLPSIDSSPPASPPPNTSRDKETPEVLYRLSNATTETAESQKQDSSR